MTREVIAVPPSLSVANAWKLMARKKIRHLPVISERKLVGIVSDRDLLRVGHIDPTGELAFVERSLADIMTLEVVVCEPSDSVAAVSQTMITRKIDALPVVSSGELVGLVTSTDLLELLVDRHADRLPFDFRIDVVATA